MVTSASRTRTAKTTQIIDGLEGGSNIKKVVHIWRDIIATDAVPCSDARIFLN